MNRPAADRSVARVPPSYQGDLVRTLGQSPRDRAIYARALQGASRRAISSELGVKGSMVAASLVRAASIDEVLAALSGEIVAERAALPDRNASMPRRRFLNRALAAVEAERDEWSRLRSHQRLPTAPDATVPTIEGHVADAGSSTPAYRYPLADAHAPAAAPDLLRRAAAYFARELTDDRLRTGHGRGAGREGR